MPYDNKPYRKQKNITISEQQVAFLKNNVGKMSIEKLATMLGLPMQKTYNNMKVLHLTKQRKKRKPRYKIVKDTVCRVVDIGTNGFFDEVKFGKLYNY